MQTISCHVGACQIMDMQGQISRIKIGRKQKIMWERNKKQGKLNGAFFFFFRNYHM